MTTSHTEIRTLPLSALVLSQMPAQVERRKHFAKREIDELAASLKAYGILNAIIARPVQQADGMFEIVAGERRYLAAEAAEFTEIPASVRPLTDEQVVEVQLIENLQRKGLHELAEAEGYEQLQKKHGYSVDDIADKVGQSKAYVYARMKLLALCAEARAAFYDGKLTASTALVLARIPVEKLQKEALKDISGDGSFDQEPMTAREAQTFVHRRYMTRLSEAPFPPEDPTLLPNIPACGRCPKNTSCQPELFEECSKKDALCTDPTCFANKKQAAIERQLAAAEEEGIEIIRGAAAKKIAPHGTYSIGGGYLKLDGHCHGMDPKHRTAKQILGKNAKPTLIERDGEIMQVVKEADVRAALKAQGVKTRQPASSSAPRAKPKDPNKADDETVALAIFRAIHAKAPKRLPVALLARFAENAIDNLWNDFQGDLLLEAYGWKEYPSLKVLERMSEAQLHQLIFEANLLERFGQNANSLQTVAMRELKIDGIAIRKKLDVEQKAKNEAKSAAPAKAAAKKKAARK